MCEDNFYKLQWFRNNFLINAIIRLPTRKVPMSPTVNSSKEPQKQINRALVPTNSSNIEMTATSLGGSLLMIFYASNFTNR